MNSVKEPLIAKDFPSIPMESNTQMIDGPKFRKCDENNDLPILTNFNLIGDPLPLVKGNIPKNNENQAILQIIGPSSNTRLDSCGCQNVCWGFCCGMTLIGCCYLYSKTILVPEGHIGFAMNSGKPEVLEPGWHCLPSPFTEFKLSTPLNTNPIQMGPVTIVRITEGCVGTAIENANLEILLPGTHCRRSGTFKFLGEHSLSREIIEFMQIKFLTVQTGFVKICYDNGRARILNEGKYAINTPTFTLGPAISIQQQNMKFDKHNVMLDGGIQMLVEGLLTFQVVDVEKLIQNIGPEKLNETLQNVSKAEISKIFSAIHLEQISSISRDEAVNPKLKVFDQIEKEEVKGDQEAAENEIRIKICERVIYLIKPLVIEWGVRIINFQLESLKLTDIKYGQEYEAASLEIAKAKANLKATVAKNEIKLSEAQMQARSQQIKAEGDKRAKVIEAEGNAEAMTIEAKARNQASTTMQDNFSKDLLMMQEKVKFARELKATTLVISEQNGISRNVVPMLNIN